MTDPVDIADLASAKRIREAHETKASSLWTVADMLKTVLEEVESGKLKISRAILILEDDKERVTERYVNCRTDSVIVMTELVKARALRDVV